MIGALIIAAATAVASPTPAAPPPALLASSVAVGARLDGGLAALAGRKAGQSPALQVAIAQDGRVVYDRAFGAASADTRFAIGSVTKTFTAVAIMQQVEAKRINLDDKVSTYLPEAPYAGQITVRQLLQHTSGLWNYGDYAFDNGLTDKPISPEAILAMAAKHPLTSTPGTKWAYSNTGYVVLGLIVERVSGMPLAQYEYERILQPAGMTQTTVGNPVANVPMATGYLTSTGSAAPAYDPSWTYGCGDIVSTAADIARFDIALLGGKLIAPETFAEMQTSVVPDESGMQGLGVVVIDRGGLQFVGHHGGLPGFEAENETVPRRQLAMVVLSDAFDFLTPHANQIVLNALFPTVFVLPNPSSAIPEDSAVTKRFRDALLSLSRGAIDRSQFSDAASSALSPDRLTQTASELKQLGDVSTITYVGSEQSASGTIYTYRVGYAGGQTLTWQFLLDAKGKIAGIGGS